MYFRPSTNEVFTLHGEIRSALWESSSIILQDVITGDCLADAGVYPLVYEKPAVEPGQMAEPLTVELIDEQWTQLWTVRDATPDELEAMKPPVPAEVTMRQARLALLAIGKLDQVAPAIESLEGAERDAARIEWEFSSTVVRSRPLVVLLGQALGLDDEELDQLFITAAGL